MGTLNPKPWTIQKKLCLDSQENHKSHHKGHVNESTSGGSQVFEETRVCWNPALAPETSLEAMLWYKCVQTATRYSLHTSYGDILQIDVLAPCRHDAPGKSQSPKPQHRTRKSLPPWACGRTGTSGPPGNKHIVLIAGIMFSLERETTSPDPDNANAVVAVVVVIVVVVVVAATSYMSVGSNSNQSSPAPLSSAILVIVSSRRAPHPPFLLS